ncbi:sensor histidine kinase [Pseudomonas petrae]|uniref:histidine kinase n=1 Tax=Pseudomonas petrae TaxID=2912190 RepID=A0ABS9I1T5_9PSED|nr:ATP-binding protein [Pseudomonas petrae]MCF7532379.1 ATP-binding protein [Pseudomonas petrae]MCF7536013.1 ATP-binding protein [Pseudomonas petrae]MCF7541763.1 ATP-binding protein [Pseudomonas petrae]MCF7557605.1 ATP-binding protein [Pseudomonas petrae]
MLDEHQSPLYSRFPQPAEQHWPDAIRHPSLHPLAHPTARLTALCDQDAAAQSDYAQSLHARKMAEFSASIAHEICQPLLGIAANAAASLRWLQRDVPDVEEAIAGLKDIRAGCERAANIVKALGALARQAPLQLQALKIDDVIREAIRLTQPALTAQRVRLETGLFVDQSIVADAVQLQQLLVNLITNAVEAMAGPGRDAAVLRINSFTLNDGVEVCIEDNGPGIPADRREQIFSAFYTTKSSGLGVGLAICRSVVDAHHGRIWAQASASGGARIRVQLPTCCY